MSENVRLSQKQEQALIELLNPENGSLEEAAEAVGVDERTIRRWLDLPHFKDQLEEAKKKLREEAFSKLKFILVQAVDSLEDLLGNGDASVKFRACKLVIESNFNLKQLENEERLNKLEKQLDGFLIEERYGKELEETLSTLSDDEIDKLAEENP